LTYNHFEVNFVTWAQAQPDILAAVVIGSRARTDPPADAWSDLDVIAFTTDASAYAARQDWPAEIGEVWLAVLETIGRGDPEWLIMFAGGLKLDVAFTLASGVGVQQMMAASPYQNVYQSGVRVLFDKSAAAAPEASSSLPEGEHGISAHPSEAEFQAMVNAMLLYAARAAKYLRRGDLWRAKLECDCNLKRRLLTMLEWHAKATHGLDYETWYDGRYVHEWGDPRAVEAFPATFGAYDADDLQRALFATLDLFRQLAPETAERLGYAYPAEVDAQMTAWMRSVAR
jgi:aminoglycoside 6-adenylyltransferase